MRAFALLLLPLCLRGADPGDILRAALAHFQEDQRSALRYTYLTTDDTKGKGAETAEVTVMEGTPYERLISRNGKTLTGEEEKKEEEKFRRARAERARETPGQREKRIRKFTEGANLLMEGADAFRVALLREEILDRRPSYVLQLTPRPDFHAKNAKLRMLTHVEARVWVDKQDLRIAKADADVTDTFAIGWIMARIERGGALGMRQIRMANGIWLPREYRIEGNARILLVDSKQIQETITFSGYQPIGREAATRVASRSGKVVQ